MLAVFRGMFLGSAQWFVSDGQRRGAAMEARAVMWVGRRGVGEMTPRTRGAAAVRRRTREEDLGGRARRSAQSRTVSFSPSDVGGPGGSLSLWSSL